MLVHVNLRGFLSHSAELSAHLDLLDRPHFLGCTETLLDASVKHISLPGYLLAHRLDRRGGKCGGGIAFFARSDLASSVAHVGDSLDFERSWFVLHTNMDPSFWDYGAAHHLMGKLLQL